MEQIIETMRILLVRKLNPFFDSSASGNRFASLVSGLVSAGAQVSVLVTGGYNNPAEKELFKKDRTYNGVEFQYLLSTCNHTIWRRRFNRYVLNGYLSGVQKNRIKKHMASYIGDYVWITNDYQVLSSFVNVYGRLRCKSLLEINEFHDIYKLSGKVTNSLQRKHAEDTARMFLEAVKHLDCFAVMTETLLEYYRKMARSDAAFIHLPMTVDMSRFGILRHSDAGEKYIAFAGSSDNSKDGLNILIESFGKIHAAHPQYQLKIAGFYHRDVEKQKQIIAEYNIQDKVQYMGVLSREQIPQFLVNASVLALARPDSHQAQGGFPTKLGEYLATKNPVCVTTTGEIGNYLTDNESAFLAVPGSVDSFADALDRAMRDGENAKKVGLAGYEVAWNNFNKDVQAKRLYDFLCNNLKKI